MIKISKDEYEDLKDTVSYLGYYWQIFRGMDTEGKINFEHSFFIRDFLVNKRFDELITVNYSLYFNSVSLTSDQYLYLKECASVTEELKEIVTYHDKTEV